MLLGSIKVINQCQDLVNYIVKIIKEVVAEEKGSQFYSLLVDRCTDKSTIGQMALFAKCLRRKIYKIIFMECILLCFTSK
jgi:hypothetical protein